MIAVLMAVHPYPWAKAWPYVGTGYALATGVLGGYAVWVIRKLRRAEHSLPAPDEGAPR